MLTTSKHLRGATELTLIADLKAELVDIADPTSYAYRLRAVLNLLFNLRQTAIEKLGLAGKAGPLEQLRMIHFVHWSVFDDDRKLLLTVSFDGPWEPYIRAIVDDAGPILDLIFCHCTDYAGHACVDGYPQFADWVRRKQVACDFFFANSPDVTVDDIEYLQRFERSHADRGRVEGFDSVAAKLRVLGPEAAPDTARYLRAVAALHQLQRFFPPSRERTSRDEGFLFARAATLITRDLKPLGLPQLPPELEQLALWRERTASEAEVPARMPARDDVVPARLRPLVQGNILESYTEEGPSPITHGCAVLVAFDDAESGRAFLQRLSELGVTTAEVTTWSVERRAGAIRRNVGLTRHGLQTLGISAAELGTFPKEFQEGMELRGGMFGDVGPAHPDQWQLPELNYPPDDAEAGRRVALPSVDAVVILQARLPQAEGDHVWSRAHPLFDEVEKLVHDPDGERLHEVQILHVQPLRRFTESGAPPREHFGFVDGVSQPVVPQFTTKDGPARDHVALGEILLGFMNAHDERAGESIRPSELVRGSTFLVLRKLAQDVEAFERSARESGDAELFKTKVLGRRPDGGALVATGAGGRNDFDYQNDPDGARCPFFSHVRRANPRATDGRGLGPPRIVRRGMGYGNRWTPGDPGERGILFMAYAASISDQFETVQRWVNGGNSAGGLSAHPDLVGGTFANHTSRALATMHGKEVLCIDVPDRAFVALRWGLYLFVPSIPALDYLKGLNGAGATRAEPHPAPAGAPRELRADAAGEPSRAGTPPSEINHAAAPAAAPQPAAGRGAELIRGLQALVPHGLRAEALTAAPYAFTGARPPHAAPTLSRAERDGLLPAFLAWKSLLEDLGRRPDATAVWAAIRARGGVLRTPYGVLVGTAALVRQVLAGRFDSGRDGVLSGALSVDEYGRRMTDTFGIHYLGMDAGGDYDREATVPNRFLQGVSRKETFISARDATREWFSSARAMKQADLKDLARRVVGRVAGEWFGLPGRELDSSMTSDDDARDERPPARCPVDFQHVSQFIFHPNPTATLAQIARSRGQIIAAVVEQFLRAPSKAARAPKALLTELVKPGFHGSNRAALIGSINGFSVPTSGSFVSVMDQWMESRELWSWQRWLLAKGPDGEHGLQERLLAEPELEDLLQNALLDAFLHTLANAPVPDLLHRRATSAGMAGEVEIRTDDRIVVSLASAVANTPPGTPPDFSLLFGGKRDGHGPLHACPGQDMAFGTLLGMLVGVLSQRNLRYEQRLTLGFD
jgi:Dyp-type peroxidase family